jgi:hydrogenase maturation protein HypF
MKAPSSSCVLRSRIRVRGIVQGVGFRPFVYNLANELGLVGYVLNSSAGVTIEIEGPNDRVEQFVSRLRNSPPPLAQIEELTIAEVDPTADKSFVIRHSEPEAGGFALVPPDVATCDDCWHEFGDPANRRFGYPFTNCTNCGPRYTIVQDIPYDRPYTTMSQFHMCPLCMAEYEDPSNRRFHAQPNACAECGPGLSLVPSNGSGPQSWDYQSRETTTILRNVRRLLREGNIVAVKGLGGFLLACDAENAQALSTLRKRKRRSDKPFALMVRDIASVGSFCLVTPEEGDALLGSKRPIVILRRREDCAIPLDVAPGNNTIGVMLPYTPLHYLLFSDSPDELSQFRALVMTSGNISEEPIVTSNEAAWEQLRDVADWFVFHNRDIYMRADDSVTRVFEQREQVLRRSRGYVPHPIDLGIEFREVLACGAELKNTFCLTKGPYAILSQHIGDLENYETLVFFEETLTNLKKLFRVDPRAVAHDLHPRYMSTHFAQRLALEPKIGVQHHQAHIASCMAENHISGKVIGVAFDGTGYGTDGKIWGGEFLVADFLGFERRAHLRYVPLPGGDAAVRQPWRMAMSYLRDAFGREADLELLSKIPQTKREIVDSMLARRFNCIDTSSCGRLFDAVASIVGLRNEVTFEGQAAIELEMTADTTVDRTYPFFLSEAAPVEIDMRPMIEAIVRDVLRHAPVREIAAAFHNTMATVIVEVCCQIRGAENLNRVCLSGGTFQNIFLLERAVRGLRQSGFEVFLHAHVPANDGGIALGQAVIANALLATRS